MGACCVAHPPYHMSRPRDVYIEMRRIISGCEMPIYHDEEIVKKVWELKCKHPDWGVRRIGAEIGESKDKVHRILKRIEKGDIEVTKNGKVIDHWKPKGVVARRMERVKSISSMAGGENQEPNRGESIPTDPLEKLLKSPWEVECESCGKTFKHSFTDEEISSLEKEGYAYVECPTCKDYAPYDLLGLFPTSHKMFIRMVDIFRAYLKGLKVIKVK